MKVLVNGSPLLAPLTGIGQYIRHLFTAMNKLPDATIRMYYGISCKQGMSLPSAAATHAVQHGYGFFNRFLPKPRAIKRLAELATFKYHTQGVTSDMLYHEPNYVSLPYKGPTVLTVCDMSCFDHPETHPAERVRLMQRHMPLSVEKADHIVVISKASGDALRRWFNVSPSKITTTYLAADERFKPRNPDVLAPFMSDLGLTAGAYVLCVGTLEPRKNLSTLFSAYAGLPANLRQSYPLVVAGMKGWGTEGLLKSAQTLVSRGELRLLGYLADELIPPLYAGAAAFCYPSRYEGFGLPALEAMASGVPVITSNVTSLPEVVGDAGIMLDPDDVDGLREQLRRLLEDKAHAHRMASMGLTRAQSFSWDRCARETYAVYEQVMLQRGCRS